RRPPLRGARRAHQARGRARDRGVPDADPRLAAARHPGSAARGHDRARPRHAQRQRGRGARVGARRRQGAGADPLPRHVRIASAVDLLRADAARAQREHDRAPREPRARRQAAVRSDRRRAHGRRARHSGAAARLRLSRRPGEVIPMKTSDVELGFLAVHEGSARVPGVVMIHDVWGLSAHTRDYASRLAREGFAVLAIDLYRRAPPSKIEDPGAWMRALSDPQVLSDLGAAAHYLPALPETSDRVGVLGFCMGGMYALMAGCADLGFSAAVPFYGLLSHAQGILHDPAGLDRAPKPRQPIAMAAELRCPLLAFFGDRDSFIPQSDVQALGRELARSGAEWEVVVVPGAGHAFMNDTRPDAYRPDDAAAAWRRTVEFLRARLA